MKFDHFVKEASDFVINSPQNYISEEEAIRPELAGIRYYDEPIFAVADVNDPLFKQLQKPEVVGPQMMLPVDWLPTAQSVISFFLPFTETVRNSNRMKPGIASDEWFHARIEGQVMMEAFGTYLCQLLQSYGFEAVYPCGDARFKRLPYSSNWSERHVAYVCGLGTFGLSKGLITKKGIAGRFGSIITSAEFPVTAREYSSPFEYCTMCGLCQQNCPAQAIDASKGVISGKNHELCSAFLKATTQPPHGPKGIVRYGCGKCQVGVPCECRIPKACV